MVVERERGRFLVWAVVVRLDDREAAQPLAEAVMWLLVGALAGVAVRFANDPLAQLVPLRRRYRSLQRWVQTAGNEDKLGSQRGRFERGLEDAADAIATLDAVAAKALLDKLQELADAGDDAQEQQIKASELEAVTKAHRSDSVPPVPGSASVPWLLDRYWLLATGLVLLVVVAAGMKTRYLDPDEVRDDIPTWFGLLLLALAFQITASTVAEAAGKLSPSASSTTATTSTRV
jgi:hypothetical protein